jgi:hypothetical protein
MNVIENNITKQLEKITEMEVISRKYLDGGNIWSKRS